MRGECGQQLDFRSRLSIVHKNLERKLYQSLKNKGQLILLYATSLENYSQLYLT